MAETPPVPMPKPKPPAGRPVITAAKACSYCGALTVVLCHRSPWMGIFLAWCTECCSARIV